MAKGAFDDLVKAAGPPKKGGGAKASASLGDPMGLPTDEEESAPDDAAEDGAEFEAACTEFVDAMASGDKTTAKEAFSAAITAKCADIMSSKE